MAKKKTHKDKNGNGEMPSDQNRISHSKRKLGSANDNQVSLALKLKG